QDLAVALVASTLATAACPRCGAPSDRVHSHYRRTVADLPCQDRPIVLRLLVRRFRCTDPGCPRQIFCERLPGLLPAHARSTTRPPPPPPPSPTPPPRSPLRHGLRAGGRGRRPPGPPPRHAAQPRPPPPPREEPPGRAVPVTALRRCG